MYKIKFWNDSIKDFQIFESPYLESALLVAYKYSKLIHEKVFVTDGSRENTYIVTEKEERKRQG